MNTAIKKIAQPYLLVTFLLFSPLSLADSVCHEGSCNIQIFFAADGSLRAPSGATLLFGEGAEIYLGESGAFETGEVEQNDESLLEVGIPSLEELRASVSMAAGSELSLGANGEFRFDEGGYLKLGEGGDIVYEAGSVVEVNNSLAVEIVGGEDSVVHLGRAETIGDITLLATSTAGVDGRAEWSGLDIVSVERQNTLLADASMVIMQGHIASATSVTIDAHCILEYDFALADSYSNYCSAYIGENGLAGGVSETTIVVRGESINTSARADDPVYLDHESAIVAGIITSSHTVVASGLGAEVVHESTSISGSADDPFYLDDGSAIVAGIITSSAVAVSDLGADAPGYLNHEGVIAAGNASADITIDNTVAVSAVVVDCIVCTGSAARFGDLVDGSSIASQIETPTIARADAAGGILTPVASLNSPDMLEVEATISPQMPTPADFATAALIMPEQNEAVGALVVTEVASIEEDTSTTESETDAESEHDSSEEEELTTEPELNEQQSDDSEIQGDSESSPPESNIEDSSNEVANSSSSSGGGSTSPFVLLLLLGSLILRRLEKEKRLLV